MEQSIEQPRQRDLGQDHHTCSLAGDGVGDLKGSAQGRRRKAERAVQKKKKQVTREKAENSQNSLHWAVILTGDSSGDTVLSLAGGKALGSHINEQKEDKNAATAQTTGEMVEAEECLQSSLEAWRVGDGWRGQEITNLMVDIFSAQEWEPEQPYPASLCGPACTHAIP